MTFDRSYMVEQADRVDEQAEWTREVIDERFPGIPLGEGPVTDELFVRWYEGKVSQQYPPQQITFPDGSSRLMSPWAAAWIFATPDPGYNERYAELRGLS